MHQSYVSTEVAASRPYAACLKIETLPRLILREGFIIFVREGFLNPPLTALMSQLLVAHAVACADIREATLSVR